MNMQFDYLQYTKENEIAIKNSDKCVCVHCLIQFDSKEIIDFIWWENSKGEISKIGSAICPNCGIDAIVPNYSIEYTNDKILEWHKQGFSNFFNHPGLTRESN